MLPKPKYEGQRHPTSIKTQKRTLSNTNWAKKGLKKVKGL